MKIVLAGGGSGGHVTPLKAIADQLKSQNKEVQLYVVTDRSFFHLTKEIFSESENINIKQIFAGKLRRYHGKSVAWHFMHLPTLVKNIRDLFYILIGVFQSIWLLLTIRPDVVFCKGGFVCVPIGYVARLLRIDLVIHDSDTKPGLTNRLLSKYSSVIATGMPAKFYPYDESKTVYTGMPVSPSYKPLSEKEQSNYKKNLGFGSHQPVMLLTGGGNGSDSLNKILSGGAGELLSAGWGIIHMTGKGKSDSVLEERDKLPKELQKNWQVKEFTEMIPRLLAADIIVCRTSASTLQECANAQKTVIGIASPNLSDQIMNAEYFAAKKSIISLEERKINSKKVNPLSVIQDTYAHKTEFGVNLHRLFAKPHAARDLAGLILEVGNRGNIAVSSSGDIDYN